MLSLEEIEQAAALFTRRIRDFHDREDAQQEFRLAAWKALEHVEPGRDPKPYQRVSGRNAVWAYCSKRRKDTDTVSLDQPCGSGTECVDSLYDVLPAQQPDPAKEAMAQDLVRALRRQIEKLPPHMRRVMELQLEGLSTRDICKKLGFTRQAINRSKSRAQALLRRRLETLKKPKAVSVRKKTSAA